MSASAVSGICLVVLAVAHSLLGEKFVIQPLLGQRWQIGLPRKFAERLLRLAWHATSVAWLSLAAALFGLSIVVAAASMMLLSSIAGFLFLRAHLSWPIFLLGSLAAIWSEGWLAPGFLRAAGTMSLVGLLVAGLLHIYWALGGKLGKAIAVPTKPTGASEQTGADEVDVPLFVPGAVLTMAVALALLCFAGALYFLLNGGAPPWARWVALVGVFVFALRAIGDARYVGFSKRVRSTAFSAADDRLFTPIVVFLALGAAAALLLST